MSQYRTLNRTVAAKIETTSGTDAVPTVAANAVLVARPASTPNLNTFETDEVTGALDARAPIPSSGNRTFRTTVYLKGPGSNVGTTVPEADAFLRSCGLARTDIAADVTGTATAGAASTITLAAGASAVNDFYKGMVINITAGTGNGQKRMIASYIGSSKIATVTPVWTTPTDATSQYIIGKNSLYRPTSLTLPTISIYEYLKRSDAGNTKLKKTLGAAGNARFAMQVSQGCYFEFDMSGSMATATDVSDPGAATYQPNRPIPFQAAQVNLGDTPIKVADFQMDLGNQVNNVEDPSTTFGLGIAGITRRQLGGQFQAPMELESVRDAVTSWQQGTQYILSAVWGTTVGNRFGIMVDTAVFTAQADSDRNGFGYDQLSFRCNASDGGFSLVYY
jgi:hypothetical protein